VVGVAFKRVPSYDYDAVGMVPSDDALAALTGHEAELNLGCNDKWLENASHDATVAKIRIDDALAWTEPSAAVVNLDCCNKALESHTVPYFRRFQATDVPPGVPLNDCFRLQPTTYWLCSADAHDIANMLLDFPTAKVTTTIPTAKVITTIIKVSHAKFSIKVKICIDGSDCVAKLRMYSKDANRALALELQRRSGCSLVFNSFYQEVGCYLAARQKSVQLELLNALEGGSSPVWTDADVGTDGVAEPAALTMLACSQSQTRRMDAGASLADLQMLHTATQVACAHEQGLIGGNQGLDAE